MERIIFLLLVNLLLNYVESVIVKTEQGKVRGETLRTVTGDIEYVSFKGIPFAKPPTGDLRFLAPQPPGNWIGIRNATEHGPVCVQISIYNEKDISGSEDCLYLNVYTPNVNPQHRLSVMVFIHGGGGFQSGSGNVDRYGPDYLMSESIILVTINYRLGVLGFLKLNHKDVPGNAGMKDQVAALKWVKKNIANFGGDPHNITILGQSAGGVSVALHNLSPMTKGLYQRSVAMSGVPLIDCAVPFKPRRLAFRLGQQLGFWTKDDQELLTFLKSVPAKSFLGLNPAVLRSETPKNTLKQLTFTPVVETNDDHSKHFLNTDPIKALKQGKVHDVDLILGHTTMETLIHLVLFGESIMGLFMNYTEMVVPRTILEMISPANMFSLADEIHAKYFGNKPIDTSVAKEFVKYSSEIYFNYGITKYATMFSKFRKTFMYKFTRLTNFTRHQNLDNDYGVNGATHDDDLLYLFYPHDGNVTIDKDSDDYKLVKKTCVLFANFVKYGNPTYNNSLGIEWPEYNNITEYYLDIDTNLTVGQHLNAETVAFWDSIYEAAELGS